MTTIIETTVGNLRASWTERGLCRLEFVGAAPEALASGLPGWIAAIPGTIEGEPGSEEIPLDLRGTPFQVRVWEALRTIPVGETTTYGAIARGLGLAPGASRAVGAACGANPVAVLVPCHRVVPASGGLGGYRWGLDRKRRLLEREGAFQAVSRETLTFGEAF
jgi:AraC family transcriptional regulator of adaptative response/methylated-DNA-[protein]-cysteine methyltransferase